VAPAAAALAPLAAVLALPATLALAPGALASTTSANRRSAYREAPRLLAAIRLPAGAVPALRDPSASRLLASPPIRPGATNLVDVHRSWIVPGDPASVLSWFDGHAPARSRASASGELDTPQGVAIAWRGFLFGPATSSFSDRELIVTVARGSPGGTAVRADAQVVWVTARPSWERVPANARVVTITVDEPGGRSSRTLTVTGAPVRRIIKLVNALGAAQPGAINCPADRGPLVSLVFRHAKSGPALATVVADGSGCGGVSFELGQRPAPPLTGGPGLVKQLQRQLHTSLGITAPATGRALPS
jgi:hypothetical protein